MLEKAGGLVLLEKIKNVDKWIVIPYFILSVFSIIMVYSASSYSALQEFGNAHYYLSRQAVFVVLGFISAFIGFIFPFRLLQKKRVVMFGIALTFCLLVYLLLRGTEEYGAQRWIVTPYFNLQPTEIAKMTVIWYFAYILSKKQKSIMNEFFKAIVAPCILVGSIVLLIFIQPDLGSSIIIFLTGAIMLFASGVSPKIGFSFSALGIGAMSLILRVVRRYGTNIFFLEDYQYRRFLAYWDPFAVGEDGGMVGNQLVNSYYALSNGGIFGVGIGNSIQKTGYLPFPYTDFIVAILGEELGLMGILFVLGVYTLLVSRMYLHGVRSQRSFDSLFCIGIASLFFIQGFVNLGGVIGLMPITGVTFPFISYGGTSLLISAGAVGLVANVSARENIRRKKQAEKA